jgi:hypothetical protein
MLADEAIEAKGLASIEAKRSWELGYVVTNVDS